MVTPLVTIQSTIYQLFFYCYKLNKILCMDGIYNNNSNDCARIAFYKLLFELKSKKRKSSD